jgi:hypothetical protein
VPVHQEGDPLPGRQTKVVGTFWTNPERSSEILRIQYRLAFRTLSPNIIRQLHRLSNFTYLLRSFASCKPTHLTPKRKTEHQKVAGIYATGGTKTAKPLFQRGKGSR